jgi:hypothetical protein
MDEAQSNALREPLDVRYTVDFDGERSTSDRFMWFSVAAAVGALRTLFWFKMRGTARRRSMRMLFEHLWVSDSLTDGWLAEIRRAAQRGQANASVSKINGVYYTLLVI